MLIKGIVGFTGTQAGMTDKQKDMFVGLITELEMTEFHHGDCIGSDKEAHDLVRIHVPGCQIVIHPPINGSKRAYCRGDKLLPPKPYLDRNHDIVRAASQLVATPEQAREIIRSGTWSTVRYAEASSRKVWLISPTGVLLPGPHTSKGKQR